MLNCEMGFEGSVIDKIKPIICVKEISGIFGNYDIIVKLECASVEEMSETITQKIRQLEKVHCTTTLVYSNPNLAYVS